MPDAGMSGWTRKVKSDNMDSGMLLFCEKDGKYIFIDSHFLRVPCTEFGMWIDKIYGVVYNWCVDGQRMERMSTELRDTDARSIMHAASNMKTHNKLNINALEKYLDDHLLKHISVQIR